MLKLTAALPASRRLDEERVRQRYYIDASWWSQADAPQTLLQTIQQAVWEDRRLTITYIPLFDMQIERVVDPYGLAAKSGAWYLVHPRAGRVRAHRVDDLVDVRLCAEKFERPVDFNLEEFWQSWCAEEAQNTSNYAVTVRVTKRALPSVTHRFGAMVRDQLADAPEGDADSRILILYFRWIDEARALAAFWQRRGSTGTVCPARQYGRYRGAYCQSVSKVILGTVVFSEAVSHWGASSLFNAGIMTFDHINRFGHLVQWKAM